MYPIHHPTLKIEQTERHREAALARLATAARSARRRWWARRPQLGAVSTLPGTMPAPVPPAPAPAASVAAEDDRVLVGR